jgi:ribonucleotide reductase beta subunit family protein with ferritin-like domain
MANENPSVPYWTDVVGLEKVYRVSNPFDFMQLISLDPCENFFEEKAVNYSMGASAREFSTDADF